jgi:hypothetical protein
MPDTDYNDEEILSNQEADYYPVNDYGDYYYYYNTPWWYSAIQAVQNAKDADVNAKPLRNTDSGRGTFTRDGSRTTAETPEASIPTVNTPTATPSASASSSSAKDNSSTSSSNNSSSNNRNSNNSNPVRNNDGNRNTSGR